MALTHRAWYLGIRARSLHSTMAMSHNRPLLERLHRERQELSRQREALRGAAEALATRLGPGHWEVALLQEVIRLSASADRAEPAPDRHWA